MDNDNKPADETQELLTTKQAAKFLGVDRKTIQRYRKDGILTPDAFGKNNSVLWSKRQLVKAATRLLEMHSASGDTLLKFNPQVATRYQELVKRSEQAATRSMALVPVSADNSRPDANEQGVTSSEQGVKSSTALVPASANNSCPEVDNVIEQGGTSSTALVQMKKTYIIFDKPEDEERYKKAPRIFPDTYFSPKDKVSNVFWNNEIKIGEYFGVPTVYKSENFGCLVKLNYDAILNSNEVITGAELSPFDRTVYDSVVTLYAAGNEIFPLQDIWRVLTQNPNAKFTEVEREKLFKSLRHIAKFWFTIVTDHSEKPEVWSEKNFKSNEKDGKNFKPERKFYKKLESIYSGQLLYFQIIGRRCVEIIDDGQNIIEKETTAEILELGFCPILYQYAKAKGQVASTPIKLINTSDKSNKRIVINRGYHNDELVTFLAREIDTMKKNSTYNKNILLERLYIIGGIENVQQGKNDLKKKRKQTRDKIEKILTHFKIKGIIKGHKFHKKVIGKASTFYSVEIII